MKLFKKLALVMSMFVVSASLLSGCTSEEAPKEEQAAAQAANADEDYVIKLGYYNCDHMTAAPIAKDAGIFDELGLNVEVTGNGKVPQAMAAGQMDAGYIGVNGLMGSAAKGAPIVIGANNHKGGAYYLVVSNDINSPQDLMGKKLGIGNEPEKNSEAWIQFAKEMDIPVEGSNYECVGFGSDSDKYLALKTGNIDGYTACDPWASVAEYEGTGKILAVNSLLEGEWGVCCTFSLNKNFTKDHPELAKKLVFAHTKAMEFIYTNPAESARIFAKNYNVPEEVALMTLYKKTVQEGRTLTWVVNPDEINREIDWKKEHGFIDDSVTYDTVVDTTFLDESGADDFDTFIKEKVDPVFPVGMSYEDWKAKVNELDKQ